MGALTYALMLSALDREVVTHALRLDVVVRHNSWRDRAPRRVFEHSHMYGMVHPFRAPCLQCHAMCVDFFVLTHMLMCMHGGMCHVCERIRIVCLFIRSTGWRLHCVVCARPAPLETRSSVVAGVVLARIRQPRLILVARLVGRRL